MRLRKLFLFRPRWVAGGTRHPIVKDVVPSRIVPPFLSRLPNPKYGFQMLVSHLRNTSTRIECSAQHTL